MKKRALISVSDKRGVVQFAKQLENMGFEIISTGGTYKTLTEAGLHPVKVSDVTNFDEILGGRVKTLHPAIHGGILADLENPDHVKQLEERSITPISVVAVNLYPFKEVIKGKISMETAVENIDIGGPAMVRASAKNYRNVTIVVDPFDYHKVADELIAGGEVSLQTREGLMVKAFEHTASYDAAIGAYFRDKTGTSAQMNHYTVSFDNVTWLRYGENPHQGAFYAGGEAILGCEQLWGKELSFNNINDLSGALSLLSELDEPACVAVKHSNPCGCAIAGDIEKAYDLAYECDPVSIFGGITVFNRAVEAPLAEKLSGIFLEIIAAPSFSEEALEILKKKKNVRIMLMKDAEILGKDIRSVRGGILVQDMDESLIADFDLVAGDISEYDKQQLLFGFKVVKHQKSNAICLVKDGATVGLGTGQVSRVGAAKIAAEQAGEKAIGSYLASDAFFPFEDAIEHAHAAGVKAIVQPGGSINDQKIIEKCKQLGIAMVIVKERHFRH